MQNIANSNDLDFSLDEIDGTLAVLRQASELTPGAVALESLDVSALRTSADAAESQTQYWARQKNNIQALLARASSVCSASTREEETKKLSGALDRCCEIWLKWDDRYSIIHDEIENRELDVTATAETSNARLLSEVGTASMNPSTSSVSDGAGTVKIPVAIASFSFSSESLKSRLETFLAAPYYFSSLFELQLSMAEGHLEGIRRKTAALLQTTLDEATLGEKVVKVLGYEGTKFRKNVKRNWEDVAENHGKEAEGHSAQRRLDRAIESYRLAITSAEEAIHIWSEIEVFYTKLRAATGLRVRRLGVRIKEALKTNVRAWQATLEQMESTMKEHCERVSLHLDQVQARMTEIQEMEREVEQKGKNAVGLACRVNAADMAAIIRHLRSAHDAYSQYEFDRGEKSEAIANEIQEEVNRRKPDLERRYRAWKEWTESNCKPDCLETDSNNTRSVWKMSFMGPLIRKETIGASAGQPAYEVAMVAEELVVELRPNQGEQAFCNDLAAQGFPGCHLKPVSKKDFLYRLCFQRREDSWLRTMDDLKTCIQENGLALRCYPDYMMEMDCLD